MRFLFTIHRYLGIAVGLLMAMWCLSGIVMMYVSYPELQEPDRLRGLQPFHDWSGCCTAANLPGLDDTSSVGAFQIEMFDGHPALRITSGMRPRLIDLTNGREISSVTPKQATSVATMFAERHGLSGNPTLLGTVTRDQWTVGSYGSDRPLYRFAMNDPAGTELYVSSTTGRAVQITTATERFWNWLGAVPHWLYPTMLRQNPVLWAQIVNWTSLIGCFLTITGLYIGITQLKRRNSKGALASPYKGVMFLHHIPGLVFGLFALVWIASGLFSMNPWGLWERGSDGEERQALQGDPPSWADVKAALAALPDAALHPATVSIEPAPYGGKLYLLATTANGVRTRLDAQAHTAELSQADLAHIAKTLSAGAPATAAMLYAHDEYYFNHHRETAPLPVFRVIRNDASGYRYYVNPKSGVLLGRIDSNAKWFRWMHQGLHRIDFTETLRSRPLWDMVMLPLLLGVTFLCLIGAYLGLRSLLWKKASL